MSLSAPGLPDWLRFWLEALLRASLEGGLVLALVWGAGRLLPRLPATVRCWLWRLAYLKLLFAFLIPGTLLIPVLPSGPAHQASYYAGTPAPATGSPAQPESAPAAPVRGPDTPRSGSQTDPLTLGGWLLFAGWVCGALWSAARVGKEWLEARRLHGECRVSDDPWLVERCAELAFLFGLRCSPRILLAEGRGSPILVGSSGPAVLLPAALLRDYSAEEVELMLAHELAHLKRGDLLWSWLPAVAHWLFFFHPVVWLANREWRLAQEIACDELALEITSAPAGEYGQVLVRVAAHSRLNLQTGFATVGLEESPDTLRRRLSAMQHPQRISPVQLAAWTAPVMLAGTLTLLPWKLTPAEAGESPEQPLRYGWQPNRVYPYEVTVEADREGYRERYTGSLSYHATQRGETVAVTHTGTLFPQQYPKEPGSLPSFPTAHLRPFPAGFGPGAGSGQVRIDPQGRILEQRSGAVLPYFLGSVARLVVEPLPDRNASRWEVSGDRAILVEERDAPGMPPTGPGFFRGGTAELAGRERARYHIREATRETLEIEKTYDLRTIEVVNGIPWLQLTGKGRLTWDLQQSLPRALEFQGSITETSANLTQRTPITLRYTLGETLAAPSAPTAAPRPQATGPEAAALLADLRSEDSARRQNAASRLATVQPGERRREVAAALEALLTDREAFTRLFAARALRVWGDRTSATAVLPLLNEKDHAIRWAAIETLGALRDSAGLRALARGVAEDQDRYFAVRALREAGSAAEEPVLELLHQREERVRVEACRILQEVGTSRSLTPLQRVGQEGGPAVKSAAEQAMTAIRARQ